MSFKALKITCCCYCTYIVPQRHHQMTGCPKCRKSSVDYEEYHIRYVGTFRSYAEIFEPPYFEDEEEYHSCLLSWLNDSDEEYVLWKTEEPDVTLIVEKIA